MTKESNISNLQENGKETSFKTWDFSEQKLLIISPESLNIFLRLSNSYKKLQPMDTHTNPTDQSISTFKPTNKNSNTVNLKE